VYKVPSPVLALSILKVEVVYSSETLVTIPRIGRKPKYTTTLFHPTVKFFILQSGVILSLNTFLRGTLRPYKQPVDVSDRPYKPMSLYARTHTNKRNRETVQEETRLSFYVNTW
jgi:hypothetical protein